MSERTIYRDMTALSEVGVPIVALPGEGYEPIEGYFLRPLVFTPDEAGRRASANATHFARSARAPTTPAGTPSSSRSTAGAWAGRSSSW